MEITREMIQRAVPDVGADRLGEFVETFGRYAAQFGIDTPLRTAHFLAQVLHESSRLRTCTENLNYSAERLLQVFPRYFNRQNVAQYARNPQRIANRVYANRMGNGSEASGDGYRFRGRGYLQLTGRANYQAYASSPHCQGDLMSHPEWLAQSPGCLKSAMWYWQKSGCNQLADRDDLRAVTRRVNGGLNGLSDRQQLLADIRKEVGA